MKQGWEYKKLGEVAEIVGGSTPKTTITEYWDGENPWVTPAELKGERYVYSTARKLTDLGAKSANLTLLPKGTVLLSSRAPIGKVAIAGTPMFCNQGFKNVICGDSLLNDYVYWLLYGKTEYLNSLGVGATFKEISKRIVENISIPVPPLTTQQSIVSELDTLSQIIADYKEQLADYDKLEQSIFYDMFGDPVKNEKGWEVKKFGQIFKLKSGDGLSTKDFIYGEIPVYGGNGISGYHNQSNKKGKFIIIGRVGAYCGNVRCVEGEFWLTDNAFELFFDIKSFDFQWLNRMLNTINLQQYANHAAQPVISNNGLKDIDVSLPPLPLQQQFASKIESIEQMKADTKAALQDAELLFQSRMDYWFNA